MSPIERSGGGGGGGSQGTEIAYAETTATVNITSVVEATPTTIISTGAITFDGAAVLCSVFAFVSLPIAVNEAMVISLFEGATQITRLAFFDSASSNQLIWPVSLAYRFTPAVGSHTYSVGANVSTTAGTPSVIAGSGGTAGNPPAFVRFTKV